MLVFNNKNHVKSGENGRHEVNVFCTFCVIPATKDRVGRSKNRTPRVKCGCDSRLIRLIYKIVILDKHRWLQPVFSPLQVNSLIFLIYKRTADSVTLWFLWNLDNPLWKIFKNCQIRWLPREVVNRCLSLFYEVYHADFNFILLFQTHLEPKY